MNPKVIVKKKNIISKSSYKEKKKSIHKVQALVKIKVIETN